MNNRNTYRITERRKFAFRRYKNETSVLNLSEGFTLPEMKQSIPFGNWVSDFHQLDDTSKQEPIKHNKRLNWIKEKLDELSIYYDIDIVNRRTRRLSETTNQYSQIIECSFTDAPDLPISNIVAPVQLKDVLTEDVINCSSAVVQLLALASRLKDSDEPVNHRLIFLDSDTIEDMPNHLIYEMKASHPDEEVRELIFLGYFSGMGFIAEEEYNHNTSSFRFSHHYEHAAEYEEFHPYNLSKAVRNFTDERDFDIDFICSDLSAEYYDDEYPTPEYEQKLKAEMVVENQLEFAKTKVFQTMNDLLYLRAIFAGRN